MRRLNETALESALVIGNAAYEDDGDTLSDEGRSYLDRIRAGARQMGELIEGLLSLAQLSRQPIKMEDGRWKMEEVDLSLLAMQVAQGAGSGNPGAMCR